MHKSRMVAQKLKKKKKKKLQADSFRIFECLLPHNPSSQSIQHFSLILEAWKTTKVMKTRLELLFT